MTVIIKAATISECGQYRYELSRYWGGDGSQITFVMLNPSTADANIDDPTVRRCMGFARREGASGIMIVNIFAFRATSPATLKSVVDPIGPLNMGYLRKYGLLSAILKEPIVCAWGSHAAPFTPKMVELFKCYRASLVCLGMTKEGHPRHPLYVKGDQPLVPFP